VQTDVFNFTGAAFYSLLPDIVSCEILGTTYGLTNTIQLLLGSFDCALGNGMDQRCDGFFFVGTLFSGDVLCFGRNPDPLAKTFLPFWGRDEDHIMQKDAKELARF